VTSTAKIAELAAADATVPIPYAGEQFTVHELKARNVTLTAEDYTVIRNALGGGKRGRARARELVPLQCPYCACRLTHFEPAQRPPYFAPTTGSSEHRERCELRQAEDAAALAADARALAADADAPELAVAADADAPEPAGDADDRALAEEPAELARAEVIATSALEVSDQSSVSAEQVSAPAALGDNMLYVIDDTSAHQSEGSSLRARLGIAPALRRDSDDPIGARTTELPDARELLTQALNRRVPDGSQVRFRGQRHAIVSASELHHHADGELVAVYGRICDASWSEVSGRLTLMAAPHTVQVWATAAVPRAVLGLRAGDPIKAPVLRKPVPFIAFGRLKKLAAVCGIPVIRRECLVMLLPLEHATATPPFPSVRTPSLRAVTDELDQLLSAPLSVQPAPCASAEAAIVQAYASLPDDALQ